jgi:hypothetical protein
VSGAPVASLAGTVNEVERVPAKTHNLEATIVWETTYSLKIALQDGSAQVKHNEGVIKKISVCKQGGAGLEIQNVLKKYYLKGP